MLAISILPAALRRRSTSLIKDFEAHYERVGIPALMIQVVTGLYLAFSLAPASTWLQFDNPITRAITIKLGLLAVTVGLAANARLRLIPKLSTDNLASLAWHIIVVTIVSVAFVIVGVGYRVGLLS